MLVKEIIEATGGILLSGDENTNIETFTQDSRQVDDGGMYIPLIGEKFDGHDFIESAFQNGATAIITMRDDLYEDKIVIKVKDTLKALQDMAHYVRVHNDVKVIAVTGSVGKTSTRDMIYSVVSQKYKTLKTEGNYNNAIGLPLTILRYKDEDVMVLEMGMNHLKEISVLSHIACPDIAVITNVGTAHIGELGSRENILKAKMEIVEGMKQGTLIINGDNDMLQNIVVDQLEVLSVGIEKHNDIHPKNIETSSSGSRFDIEYLSDIGYIQVPVQGKHFITNALMSYAVGKQLDMAFMQIQEGIRSFKLTKNRMDIIPLKQKMTIIDGTYNASEDSMKSSLDVLKEYPNRKIAVLADMLELGDYSQKLHTSVGKYTSDCDIDLLIGIGQEAHYICQGALKKGMYDVYHFDTNQEAIDFLLEELQEEDTILIKGSHGMNLKEVVKALKQKYA